MNQRGISTILAVLGLGVTVLAIIMAGMNQSQVSLEKVKGGRAKHNQLKNLVAELNYSMSSSAGCGVNFNNLSITPANTSQSPIKINDLNYATQFGTKGASFFSNGGANQLRYDHVVIESITLEADPNKFGTFGAGAHLANLQIKGRGGDGRLNATIPIRVITNPSGLITSCKSTQFVDDKYSTYEEAVCNDPMTLGHTNPQDCLDCLSGPYPYNWCIYCKQNGKVYNGSPKDCDT
jgi:hypothetical protein